MLHSEHIKHYEVGRESIVRNARLSLPLANLVLGAPFANIAGLLIAILHPATILIVFPFCFLWTLLFILQHCFTRPLLAPAAIKGVLSQKMLPIPFYLGATVQTGKKPPQPLWADKSLLLTHMMVLGTTGSGKTQFLLGLLHQALLQGSGFIFVDGKGDIENWRAVYGMAQSMGVQDNLLLLNLSVNGASSNNAKISNTWNPFARGGSDELMELISGFLGASQSDGGMWKGRATVLGRIVLRALCEYRDTCGKKIVLNDFADNIELSALEKIMTDKRISALTRKLIQRYLHTLPGWKMAKNAANGNEHDKAEQVANEQHGYLTMQYTNLLDILIGTYQHITQDAHAEIDFKDIIQNKRMLYIILPSLEKSPDTLKILGQVVVSSLKIAIAESLGANTPNSLGKSKKEKTLNTAFPIICDEYGYYSVEGFANLPAQIRSSGISITFSGQDFDSFKKGSEIEAAAILQNTTTKVFMKSQPGATTDLAVKYSGDAYFFLADSLQSQSNFIATEQTYSKQSGLHKVSRLTQDDLGSLKTGQAYIFYENQRWLINTYYGRFEEPTSIKVNQFIPLPTIGEHYEVPH